MHIVSRAKSTGTTGVSLGRHKTTEQTKVLSQSDVYFCCGVKYPTCAHTAAWTNPSNGSNLVGISGIDIRLCEYFSLLCCFVFTEDILLRWFRLIWRVPGPIWLLTSCAFEMTPAGYRYPAQLVITHLLSA
jgi:hypothetical protein